MRLVPESVNAQLTAQSPTVNIPNYVTGHAFLKGQRDQTLFLYEVIIGVKCDLPYVSTPGQ